MYFDKINLKLNKLVFRAKISKGTEPMIFRLSKRSVGTLLLTGFSQKCGSLPVSKRKATGTDCFFGMQGLFVVRFVREIVFFCISMEN